MRMLLRIQAETNNGRDSPRRGSVAHSIVAPVSNLLYRRLPVGPGVWTFGESGLEETEETVGGFSGDGGCDHGLIGGRRVPGGEGHRILGQLFAQERDQVQARGAFGPAPPLGQGFIDLSPFGSVAFQARQQEPAIHGDEQGGHFTDRVLVPDLGLTHPEEVFFIAVIDLNAPAIKVSLQQHERVGGQQLPRPAIHQIQQTETKLRTLTGFSSPQACQSILR